MTIKLFSAMCLLSAGCSAELATSDPPAPEALATVHAYEESIGAAGRIAVFQDPAGRALATVVTGDDGTATQPVAPGDMVTIANVGSAVFDLTTYVDVAPGDELVIGELEAEDTVRDFGAVPVALPEPVTGASRYDIGLGLSLIDYPGVTTTLHLTDRQVDARGDFQILALARDTTGVPVAFSLASSTSSVVGSPTSLPAWRTDWDRVGFALDGLAADAQVTARVDLVQGESGHFPGDAVTPADHARFDIQVPRGLGDELQYDLAVREGSGERRLIQRQAVTSAIALDAAQALLPRVGNVAIEPGEDPARPTLRWTIDGDASRADFVMLRLRWGDGASQWTVILPPSHDGQFQLPALPDVLAAWRPGVAGLEVAVGLVELSSLADYRAVVRRGVEELDDLERDQRISISQAGPLGL